MNYNNNNYPFHELHAFNFTLGAHPRMVGT
jgi:hypothetical protein